MLLPAGLPDAGEFVAVAVAVLGVDQGNATVGLLTTRMLEDSTPA